MFVLGLWTLLPDLWPGPLTSLAQVNQPSDLMEQDLAPKPRPVRVQEEPKAKPRCWWSFAVIITGVLMTMTAFLLGGVSLRAGPSTMASCFDLDASANMSIKVMGTCNSSLYDFEQDQRCAHRLDGNHYEGWLGSVTGARVLSLAFSRVTSLLPAAFDCSGSTSRSWWSTSTSARLPSRAMIS